MLRKKDPSLGSKGLCGPKEDRRQLGLGGGGTVERFSFIPFSVLITFL